ncbi:AMP-binding protein [Achromobacter aloeverae]|uniref:AMP-dependent synthetase n=1 Tax=Achromobacter aloeverae TaxID=1750518 RepID=A0A4Q1HGU9_9BURK|nr:AMP-binding protein [Achromobacter aloeverae]RXN86722.1 AMP-dependent synthetase [Achromobacter aloeverae]
MQASPDTTHVAIAPVPDETLAELLARRAAEDPDGVYCYFKDDVLTLGALNARVNQLANLLWRDGLRPGDRVGLMLPSHPDHIVAIFALAKLGLVRVPINVHLKGASLQHLFDHLAPRALIADAEYADALAPELSKLERVLWRGGQDAARAFEGLASQSAAAPPVRPAPDDILALTPSSGTTGAPKGVLKSDRTLRAGPQAILRLTGARPGNTFLLWESLHHGAGVAVIISALIGGTRLAMVERFSASRFWDDARRYNVTHIHYLGTVIPMLLKQPARDGDRTHGVRIAWGGGCPPDLWKTFSERFGVEMREGYGLSELITFVTVNPDGPAGAIGKALDYYDVMLADDEGKPVPVGQTGEITVRARVPELGFLGYFRNPEAEASSRRGDWFLTGDLGRQDAQGFLYYAGRKKEMLRRRGINISTWEVERVLAEHPDIEELALVGVPSDLGEDELKLFVRVREKAAGMPAVLDPLALIKWSEARLPYYQIPRYVAFIDEFPKTPTQRIQKKELPRTVADAWDLERSGYRIGK